MKSHQQDKKIPTPKELLSLLPEESRNKFLRILGKRELDIHKVEYDIREGIRDIVLRTDRPTSQGGYPADTIVEYLFVTYFSIYRHLQIVWIEEVKKFEAKLKSQIPQHYLIPCDNCGVEFGTGDKNQKLCARCTHRKVIKTS